jgi:primosomal protein N' (replication factor Y)
MHNPQNTPDDPLYFAQGARVAVLTTQPLDHVLDYKAPEGGVRQGAFVEVPLGPRKVLGVVWGKGEGNFDIAKLRAIIRVLDVAPMQTAMREFLTRAADYTITPVPAMLRLATRLPGLGNDPRMRKILRLADKEPDRMTPARARVIAVLEEHGGGGFTPSELAGLAGVTSSVVKGLVKQMVLIEEATPHDAPFERLDPTRPGKRLSEDGTQV